MTLQNIKLLMKGKNVNKNGELSACQYHHTARPPKISTFINRSTNKNIRVLFYFILLSDTHIHLIIVFIITRPFNPTTLTINVIYEVTINKFILTLFGTGLKIYVKWRGGCLPPPPSKHPKSL